MHPSSLVERIDAILPQTQCTKCGHEGCRPYAEALAQGRADINRCPPGGAAGIQALAALLGRPARPLDAECGEHLPLQVAVIDEAHCIGCTLCIQACPVDAIVGATKRMHTVLADTCTGCDLCVPPCPVDCIAMVPAGRDWTPADAGRARLHYGQREARLAAQHHEDSALAARTLANKAVVARAAHNDAEAKGRIIADALARARARRQARSA
jgi:electron transport complex protein RnfB